MADTRTATERCVGVTIDEAVILAAKDHFHIVDDDFFDFRAKAHREAEALEESLRVEGHRSWCEAVMAGYGPDGTRLRGALRR